MMISLSKEKCDAFFPKEKMHHFLFAQRKRHMMNALARDYAPSSASASSYSGTTTVLRRTVRSQRQKKGERALFRDDGRRRRGGDASSSSTLDYMVVLDDDAPTHYPLEKREEEDNGASSSFEVVRATARTSPTEEEKDEEDEEEEKVLCICVPGNPGVAEYYSNFVRALSEALVLEHRRRQTEQNVGGVLSNKKRRTTTTRVVVECVGFLGHHAEAKIASRTPRWYTLDEQKAHVLRYVKSRVMEEEKTKTRCFLVGHSIGSHVALHVVNEMRSEEMEKMVGLMPFLHVNEKSKMQKFLAWLVSLRVVVRAVAKLLGFMQRCKALKKAIENRATKGMKSELGISVTKRWAREMSLVNMALMGDTEFKFLRDWKGNVVDAMKAHAKKICFVYAGEDHWGPLHQRDKLMDEIEGLEIVTDESYEHAFVLDDESSNKLALQCARMLLG